MFNAIADSGVKIDARANINSTSDPTSLIPTPFCAPKSPFYRKEGELYRTSVLHLTSLV